MSKEQSSCGESMGGCGTPMEIPCQTFGGDHCNYEALDENGFCQGCQGEEAEKEMERKEDAKPSMMTSLPPFESQTRYDTEDLFWPESNEQSKKTPAQSPTSVADTIRAIEPRLPPRLAVKLPGMSRTCLIGQCAKPANHGTGTWQQRFDDLLATHSTRQGDASTDEIDRASVVDSSTNPDAVYKTASGLGLGTKFLDPQDYDLKLQGGDGTGLVSEHICIVQDLFEELQADTLTRQEAAATQQAGGEPVSHGPTDSSTGMESPESQKIRLLMTAMQLHWYNVCTTMSESENKNDSDILMQITHLILYLGTECKPTARHEPSAPGSDSRQPETEYGTECQKARLLMTAMRTHWYAVCGTITRSANETDSDILHHITHLVGYLGTERKPTVRYEPPAPCIDSRQPETGYGTEYSQGEEVYSEDLLSRESIGVPVVPCDRTSTDNKDSSVTMSVRKAKKNLRHSQYRQKKKAIAKAQAAGNATPATPTSSFGGSASPLFPKSPPVSERLGLAASPGSPNAGISQESPQLVTRDFAEGELKVLIEGTQAAVEAAYQEEDEEELSAVRERIASSLWMRRKEQPIEAEFGIRSTQHNSTEDQGSFIETNDSAADPTITLSHATGQGDEGDECQTPQHSSSEDQGGASEAAHNNATESTALHTDTDEWEDEEDELQPLQIRKKRKKEGKGQSKREEIEDIQSIATSQLIKSADIVNDEGSETSWESTESDQPAMTGDETPAASTMGQEGEQEEEITVSAPFANTASRESEPSEQAQTATVAADTEVGRGSKYTIPQRRATAGKKPRSMSPLSDKLKWIMEKEKAKEESKGNEKDRGEESKKEKQEEKPCQETVLETKENLLQQSKEEESLSHTLTRKISLFRFWPF